MLKHFLSNSLIYTIITVFNRGISFLMIPLMTKYLSPEDYGTLELIIVISTILMIFCGFEIHQALSRFWSEIHNQKEKQLIFSSVMIFLIVTYVLFAVVFNLLGNDIWVLLLNIKERAIVNEVIIYFLLQAIVYYISVVLRFDLRIKANALLNFVTGFSVISFSFLFLIYFRLGMSGILHAYLLGSFIGLVLAIYLTKNLFIFKFSFLKIKELLSYSYPLMFSSLSVLLMMYGDRMIIKSYLSLHDLGVFSVGNKFASAISILMMGIQLSIGPLIYSHMKSKTFAKDLGKLFEQFFGVAIVTLFIIQIFAEYIFTHMVDMQYYNGITTFRLMSIAIFLSQLYIFFPGLQINKRPRKIMIMNIFGAILNLILCSIFVRMYGINGAGVSGILSYTIFNMIYFYLSQREIKLNIHYWRILLIYSVFIIYVCYYNFRY